MDNYKITEKEMNSGVSDEPNILSGTPHENKAVFDYLPRLIAGKVNGFIDAVISKFTDYYNKGEIDSKETALSDRINAKANSAEVYVKSETYTKAETDTKLDAKADANDVYTKSQTYTKEETDGAINEKVTELGAGDMAKSVYDTDGDGVVDKAETAENAANAEKLNGQAASYYATKTEAQAAQTTADNAAAAAATAQTTANNAMPKGGGTFIGNTIAYSNNRAYACIRNIEVLSADWNPNIVTNYIRCIRK